MKKLVLLVALLTVVAFASSVMAQAPAKPAGTAAPAVAPAAAPADKAKADKPADKPKADKPKAAAKPETFKGSVVKVDEAAKAVVVKGKEEKTFAVDEKTKITKGKDTLALADLKAEMAVTVSYKKDGDKMVASAIKADAPKAPKADKPKADKPAEAPKK
jgi:hypothetical protein